MSSEPAPGRSAAALGIGAVFGALAAVPAVVRVTSGGAGSGVTLLALAGGSAVLLGLALALLALAHERSGKLAVVLAGVGLSAWPVARFGSLLEATTHHRPLGAATFAIGALVLVLGCLLVAQRVAALDGHPAGRMARPALLTAAVVSTGWVVLTALLAEATRPHVVDALLLVAGGGLGWAVLRRPALVRSASRLGAFLWAVLAACHLFAATRPSFDQIRERAPVFSGPLGWL